MKMKMQPEIMIAMGESQKFFCYLQDLGVIINCSKANHLNACWCFVASHKAVREIWREPGQPLARMKKVKTGYQQQGNRSLAYKNWNFELSSFGFPHAIPRRISNLSSMTNSIIKKD